MSAPIPPTESRFDRFLQAITRLGAFALVVLTVIFVWDVIQLRTQSGTIPGTGAALLADEDTADLILERANDAIGSVDLVLSFLEGAAVLIGLGFGALTYYGMRNSQETRAMLREEAAAIEETVKELEGIREELQAKLSQLEVYEPDLQNLRTLRQDLTTSQDSLLLTIDNVARVLQADQEFRLKNHDTAYKFASRVLEQDPDNWLALYIAGWLEVHQMDKLDAGIEHLKQAMKLEDDWPAVQAAYGVALRRKARGTAEGPERDRLFNAAEGALLSALSGSPNLMDFNSESFWGSVGGIRLETGRPESAMEAYEKALAVTPGSSYPAGNAAALRLRYANVTGTDENKERALDAFKVTLDAARREQILNPDDYWLWMDIAQAQAILGQREPDQFTDAHDALNRALATRPSVNALQTSRRGWQTMADNCPPEWTMVQEHIEQALQQLDEIIAAGESAD